MLFALNYSININRFPYSDWNIYSDQMKITQEISRSIPSIHPDKTRRIQNKFMYNRLCDDISNKSKGIVHPHDLDKTPLLT